MTKSKKDEDNAISNRDAVNIAKALMNTLHTNLKSFEHIDDTSRFDLIENAVRNFYMTIVYNLSEDCNKSPKTVLEYCFNLFTEHFKEILTKYTEKMQ